MQFLLSKMSDHHFTVLYMKKSTWNSGKVWKSHLIICFALVSFKSFNPLFLKTIDHLKVSTDAPVIHGINREEEMHYY